MGMILWLALAGQIFTDRFDFESFLPPSRQPKKPHAKSSWKSH